MHFSLNLKLLSWQYLLNNKVSKQKFVAKNSRFVLVVRMRWTRYISPLIDLVVVVMVVNDVLVVDVIAVDRVVGVFIASNIPVPENISIWATHQTFSRKTNSKFSRIFDQSDCCDSKKHTHRNYEKKD